MKITTAQDAFEQGKTAYEMGMELRNDPYSAGAPASSAEGLRSQEWRKGMLAAWEAAGKPANRLEHDIGASNMNTTEKAAEEPVAPLYSYTVNLNERGCFSASVYDSNDKSVYEVRGGDELGEDESSLVDDGFMRNMEDLDGLSAYLKSIGIIPAGARILPEKEFEAALDEYVEAEREANKRVLYILVAPTVNTLDLEPEDEDVAGAYQVRIYADVPEQDRADTALDIFHENIAIESLEDFDISVVDPAAQQILEQNDDYIACSGRENGTFDDKIDEDYERYMPRQPEDGPTPSM